MYLLKILFNIDIKCRLSERYYIIIHSFHSTSHYIDIQVLRNKHEVLERVLNNLKKLLH